jgi:hypothetical protein
MAYTDEHRVEVYVRAADTPQTLSYTLAHELGHVIDLTASTPARRAAYRDLRGLGEAAPWFGCDACTDVETPAGDFAETVGYALTDPGYDWSSRLGPRPTPAQVAAVRALYRF